MRPLTKRMEATIRRIVEPLVHSMLISKRTKGSYGNVLLYNSSLNCWFIKRECPLRDTTTLVIFRNGLRQTRNTDYYIDPLNIRKIIPITNWNGTDIVIADVGL